MTKQTQEQQILGYLAQGFTITGMEALDQFGCWSLPKRICELKKQGWAIDSWFTTTKSGKHIKVYKLGEPTERVVA